MKKCVFYPLKLEEMKIHTTLIHYQVFKLIVVLKRKEDIKNNFAHSNIIYEKLSAEQICEDGIFQIWSWVTFLPQVACSFKIFDLADLISFISYW